MFLWFIGTVVLAVWWVFRDPGFDYRSLVLGALLPLVDLGLGRALGGVLVFHSIVGAVVILGVVMGVTRGRRVVRKSALGVPIGVLVHLVMTGAWRRTSVFWWPVAGLGADGSSHPVVERGWWNVLLELVGLVSCLWIVRRADLIDPARRSVFRRTGRLDFTEPGG